MEIKQPCLWLSVCLCLVAQVFSTEYDYIYNADDYNHPDRTIHGDYLRDWNPEWTRAQRPKCIDIPTNLTLCQNIGYKSMRLPNLLDHDTLNEVTQQARSWVPLLNIHCHPDAKLFLCSLFSPVCLERTIWPCRSLCESVKRACLVRMKFYEFDWPEMLRCDRFPVDNDLCIKQQNYPKPCNVSHCKNEGNSSGGFLADNKCEACPDKVTYEVILDNYCRAEYVMRVSVTEVQHIRDNSLVLLKKNKKFYKKDIAISLKEKKKMALVMKGESCQCEVLNNTKSKQLMMGTKSGNDFVLSFVVPWERKNKDFKNAIKKIKQGHNCTVLITNQVIGDNGGTKPTDLGPSKPKKTKPKKDKKKKKKKNRRKNRKGKRKGKGKGKGKNKGKKKNRNNKKNKKRRPKKNRKNGASNGITPSP